MSNCTNGDELFDDTFITSAFFIVFRQQKTNIIKYYKNTLIPYHR